MVVVYCFQYYLLEVEGKFKYHFNEVARMKVGSAFIARYFDNLMNKPAG